MILKFIWLSFGVMGFAKEPLIIAHRGASADAPENTLAAFKLGWEQGADAVELDIHQSSDGKIVVIHDATTKRTAGLEGEISKLTLKEIKALEVGSWKGPTWKGKPIPTLAEALKIIPAGKKLVIEIKCSAAVLPELQRDLLASGKKSEDLIIIAFAYETIRESQRLFPSIIHLWLVSGGVDRKTGKAPEPAEVIAKAKASGVRGINVNPKFAPEIIAQCKAADLECYVWTVNDAAEARRWAAAGVHGITTDKPLWIREQLRVPNP
jgi:glycerophosphoryl diester phosphodiesterase